MDEAGHRRRLAAADAPRGGARRTLAVAGCAWRFVGLDEGLAAALDRRWGPFVSRSDAAGATRVEVTDAGPAGWLAPPAPGERYRLEPLPAAGGGAVSYAFAVAARDDGWRMAITRDAHEPAERTVENGTRWLVARSVLDAGGLALHGAGIERRGRGWVFAGPSNAGKSTAVGLSAGARSLGDDFAAILPAGAGFRVAPVPFDNRERILERSPRTAVPLAGVLRLAQAASHRVVTPARGLAAASLATCAAFPWALPDRADRMLAAADAIARAGLVFTLEFSRDGGFWDLLDALD